MENIKELFKHLRFQCENEVIEFKKAERNFDITELGKYFSALSNEANLRGLDFAWLVFGVEDKSRIVTGTSFKEGQIHLERLKETIAQNLTERISFRDIYEDYEDGKRFLIFKIPAAPRGLPIAWNGQCYGRREESLVSLDPSKYDEIRNQTLYTDWSAVLVPEATLKDLDEEALAKARVMFKKVNPRLSNEVDEWDNWTFLQKAEVAYEGQLTRAALLLLGKEDCRRFMRPAVLQITWVLRDSQDMEIDYEHFTIPYLMTVDKVLAKIRNLTFRELPGGTLFPDTMKQYDDYTIREALHNCIAHTDYKMEQRITLVEVENTCLYFSNGGGFIPGNVENAIRQNGPQKYYRNRCLCSGMVNFNMIDTIGRGIKKMFMEQRKRYFPMPDYIIDNVSREVTVKIYGQMLDSKYVDLLKSNLDLSLAECMWLDAIQKHRPVTDDAIKNLKNKGLIEGRKPHFFISVKTAKAMNQIPEYVRLSGIDKDVCWELVKKVLLKSGDKGVTRLDIFKTLTNALSEMKDENQKLKWVSNYLAALRREHKIEYKDRRWFLVVN